MKQLLAQDHHWKRMLEPSLKHCDGKYWMQDIEAGLYDGTMQLWDYGDTILITWVEEYPRKRVLCVGFGAGNMETVKRVVPEMAAFARECNCQALEVNGRTGWARALRQYGFEKTSETARLQL